MGLIFNGKSSRDYGLIVTAYPSLNHGAKRGEGYQIMGRNGTFYTEDGTFDNYIQTYEIAVREKCRGADLRAADIAAWLLGSKGFCRLEDVFEPEYFKMARYAGPLNIEQMLGAFGRCTLEFDCLPERWLLSGQEEISTTPSNIPPIYNPTGFKAWPIFKVVGASDTAVEITVNGTHYLSVPAVASTAPVTIDCQERTIVNRDGESLAAYSVFYTDYNDFPVFVPGENTITVENAYSFKIIPRWWTL